MPRDKRVELSNEGLRDGKRGLTSRLVPGALFNERPSFGVRLYELGHPLELTLEVGHRPFDNLRWGN
jgi:hypothetical protein